MGKHSRCSPRFVALLVLAAGLTACQEKRTLTPLDPTAFRNRVLEAVEDFPDTLTYNITAGRWGSVGGEQLDQSQLRLSRILVVDWTSAANRVTVSIHRTGSVETTGTHTEVIFDNCFTPVGLDHFGVPGGTLLTAPQSLPTCPVVWSDTSNEKPKILELKDATTGTYNFVVTNVGPGNETLKVSYFVE